MLASVFKSLKSLSHHHSDKTNSNSEPQVRFEVINQSLEQETLLKFCLLVETLLILR